MPDRDKKQLRIEPWNYDVQEAKRRIKTAERIIHLRKLLDSLLGNISNEERNSIYFDILFIKILADNNFIKLQTSINLNREEFISALETINNKYGQILSPLLSGLSEDQVYKILRELQRFDFTDLEIGKDDKKGVIKVDNDLEFIIFGKRIGVRQIEHKFLECLGINKKSRIFCEDFELELFSYLFFMNTFPEKIAFTCSTDILKKSVIFGLLYKFTQKIDFIFNIVSFSNSLKIQDYDIIILRDESLLAESKLDTDENIKIVISNLKNCFMVNQFIKNTINKFGVIYNIDYQKFDENGNEKRMNGLIIQKYFNHRSGLLNALDKMKLNSLENKKAANLNKNILSLTINCLYSSDSGNPVYSGGLKPEDNQSKQIESLHVHDINKLVNVDKLLLEEIDTLFDYLRFDDIDDLEKMKKYQNSSINFDLRNRDLYCGVFELNLPRKQTVLDNDILHPLYYRREFNNQRKALTDEKYRISEEIIDTILFGKEYDETKECSDSMFMDKDNYTPVLNSDSIRFGNFPDLTKVLFVNRRNVQTVSSGLIKEDDILISFKRPEKTTKTRLAWCIAPKVLDGALPGKDIIAIRLDTLTVSPFQYIEFLNLIASTGISSQISELISLNSDEYKFEDSYGNFLRSFFLGLPFPLKMKECLEATSWMKKKICDTYFGLLSFQHNDLNELFQNLLKGLETDKSFDCYPASYLWQKAYLELLWEYNKKPERIILISDHNSEEYKKLLLEYFSSLEVFINDIPFNNRNFKSVIKDFFAKKIDLIRSTSIAGFPKNAITIICCDNLPLLSYYYENIRNLSSLKSVYFIYSKVQETQEIFDEEYDKILKFFNERHIDIVDRIKLEDMKLFLRNPFQIEKKFLASLLNYHEVTVNESNQARLYSMLSNILKEYADHIISHHSYYDQSAFFFLESNHFANKAMELKTEENKNLAKKAEWEQIIDQLAHSLNTNIGAAKNSIRMLVETLSEKAKKDLATRSDKYLTEVADLVELTLNSVKVNVEENITLRNLSSIIHEQIEVIKEGIETLKFSGIQHKINVRNMNPILELDDTIMLETYIRAAELIIKDLLKNAFTNTGQENPFVKIKTMQKDDEYFILQIENNKAISHQWAKRINEGIEDENLRMSKTQAVGMKVVRKWNEKLRWSINVAADEINNFTTTTLTIPVKWKNSKY